MELKTVTMEKKPYVEPQTKVVEVDDVEIICTSTQTEQLNEDLFNWDE